MKTVLPFLILLAILITPLYPVYAMDMAPSTTSSNLKPSPNVKFSPPSGLFNGNKLSASLSAALKDKIASREALFKKRLLLFKDKSKATKVTNINTMLGTINQNATTQMSQNLTKISAILTQIENKVTELSSSGKDLSAVNTSLNTAKGDLQLAQSALEAQQSKQYVIDLTSETSAKLDAQTARNQLHTDLIATQAKIILVRKDLSDTIKAAIDASKGTTNGQ